MTKIDKALSRIDGAIARLEAALEDRPAEAVTDLAAERERLESEVQSLRLRAEEDARLRAEAADAVREALLDLKSAVGEGGRKGQANA